MELQMVLHPKFSSSFVACRKARCDLEPEIWELPHARAAK